MAFHEVNGTAKDIADRVAQSSADADSSVKGAASKAGAAARDIAAQTSNAANDLYDRAQSKLRDAAERLPENASNAIETGRTAYSQSSRSVARHIAKQPFEALILAGAIGYLVGWATNRS
jgi:ElaB/YqjD/DUF883 family membrane-anchored ribosome-binding protein